jgi:hypothetical protein
LGLRQNGGSATLRFLSFEHEVRRIFMRFSIFSFMSVTLFALVHLFADKVRRWDLTGQKQFLSVGSGVAIAYVFLDLLPKLSKNDAVIRNYLREIFPYFERHVYLVALFGFLLFFIVDRSQKFLNRQSTYFYLSLSSYALFNFLVGYAVVDKRNPEIQPLLLFTFAIALHYFMNDHSLTEAHGKKYQDLGRWILIACLYLGWLAGFWLQLAPSAVAIVSAFIGGGVIMNVTRHELPNETSYSLITFLIATAVYAMILLFIGN